MTISNNKFWRDFIDIFRNERALWDIKSDNYKIKNKRDKSWAKLAEKYKEYEPGADVNTVKRKINGMRNSYRRELKKLRKSIKSGKGEGNVYKPSLWYFKALDFIRETVTTSDTETLVEDESDEKEHRQPKRKKEPAPTDEFIGTSMLTSKRLKKNVRSYQKVAEVWADKLNKMDDFQAIIAEKIINDTIFKGQLGKLNLASAKQGESQSSIFCSPIQNPLRVFNAADGDDSSQSDSEEQLNNIFLQSPVSSPMEYIIPSDDN